jgi:hypothetical protein
MQNPAAPAPHFRETKANDQATLKPALPKAEILTAMIGKPSLYCHGSAVVPDRRGAAEAATPKSQRGFPSP